MIVPYENKRVSYKQDWRGYVYLMKCDKFYKIGYSKNPKRRMMQLDVRPYKMELLMSKFSFYAYKREQNIHSEFMDYRVANEWYDFSSGRAINISNSGKYVIANEDMILDLLFNVFINWDDRSSCYEDFLSIEEYERLSDNQLKFLSKLDRDKEEYYRRVTLQ